MTYPRNAASPEPIAIGAVVQISDGAVQTSGCTVRIKPVGVAEGDGGGTTAYSTDGIVLYIPTQAETNYTSFVLIAKKTGCIPVAVTVVTSASATAGYVGTDQGKIANPTSTVNLSGTTIKAVTDAVTVGTNNDKTGYALTQAFPSNFAALGINASGHVSRVTLTDDVTTKTGYSLAATGLDAVLAESGLSAGAGLTNDTGTQLTSINLRQAISACLSALAGVISGAASNTPVFKQAGKPAGNTRISATTTTDGRTAVNLKVPD